MMMMIVCKEQRYHSQSESLIYINWFCPIGNPFSTASSFCHLWCVHKFTVSRETLSLTLYSWESTFTVRFDFYSAASNQVYCFTVAFQSVSLFIGYLALVCSVFRHLACTYEQSLLLLSYARASDAVSRHCCVLSRLCLEFPCLVLFFSRDCVFISHSYCAPKNWYFLLKAGQYTNLLAVYLLTVDSQKRAQKFQQRLSLDST